MAAANPTLFLHQQKHSVRLVSGWFVNGTDSTVCYETENNLSTVRMVKKGSDPILYVEGTGHITVSELRFRVANLLANAANGINKEDERTEQYLMASFSSNSELLVLVRALSEYRKLK